MPIRLITIAFLTTLGLGSDVYASNNPICDQPSRYVCSQRKIEDGYGVTYVGVGYLPVIGGVRRRMAPPIRKSYADYFAVDESGQELKRFASYVGLDGWFQTSCWSWTSQRCRNAVTEALVKKTLSAMLETDDDRVEIFGPSGTDFRKSKSLRNFARLLQEPIYQRAYENARTDERRLTRRPRTEGKVRAMFKDLKNLYVEKLKTWPIPQPHKARMIARVRALRYVGTKDCDSDGVPPIYNPNAFNVPETKELSVCNGLYLKSNSPAALAFILAHEIAHTFGPCSYFNFGSDRVFSARTSNIPKPTGGLTTCLEHLSRGAQPTCDIYDQIDEIFADWAATEVVPAYLEHQFPAKNAWQQRARYLAAFAITCGTGERSGDPHLSGRDRIDSIIFQNPVVRKLSSCGPAPGPKYCSFDAAMSAMKPPPRVSSPSKVRPRAVR